MSLEISLPAEGSPTSSACYSSLGSCSCSSSTASLLWTGLFLPPTPVHCQTPSAPKPTPTNLALPSTSLFVHGPSPLSTTLVVCLITLSSKASPTLSTHYIPLCLFPSCYLSLLMFTQALPPCFPPFLPVLCLTVPVAIMDPYCPRSLFTRSLHLLLGPPHGRVWGNHPNRHTLGRRLSRILAKCPSHSRRLLASFISMVSTSPYYPLTNTHTHTHTHTHTCTTRTRTRTHKHMPTSWL